MLIRRETQPRIVITRSLAYGHATSTEAGINFSILCRDYRHIVDSKEIVHIPTAPVGNANSVHDDLQAMTSQKSDKRGPY